MFIKNENNHDYINIDIKLIYDITDCINYKHILQG